jgi:hypothetical protein
MTTKAKVDSTPKKSAARKTLAGSVPKTAEEIKKIGIEALPALALSGTSVGCWFKDASGGPDYCVPMPSADACTNAQGTPTNGTCPNTFAFLAGHIADLHAKVDDLNSRLTVVPQKKKGSS